MPSSNLSHAFEAEFEVRMNPAPRRHSGTGRTNEATIHH
jgi:hypothetical protein